MLKTIGSLHNVPAPSSAVLGESLKLLATFGDKKAITALLEQVRDVQANNEQVFRETQEAIGKLSVERKELDERRQAFAAEKAEQDAINNQRTVAISQAEARLSGKVSVFANDQALARSALDEKERRLADLERTVRSRELKCEDSEQDVDRRIAALNKYEADLNLRSQRLQEKENKLRAALSE